MRIQLAALLTCGIGLAGAAGAQSPSANIDVTADITVSTTWTANNVYNLRNQIYVKNGATLCIEAGTLIASEGFGGGEGGSLAVTKGSQIFIKGTECDPVIMTSVNDTLTWTKGDRKTGTWREAANEWGNLTIMGCGYISENKPLGQNLRRAQSLEYRENVQRFLEDLELRAKR